MSGGLKPGGATSGLPAGGTSADVLTGAGTWKAGSDVLHDGLATFTGSVAGRVIVGDGAGDVQPTSSAVSALLASADAAALLVAASLVRNALCERTTVSTSTPLPKKPAPVYWPGEVVSTTDWRE